MKLPDYALPERLSTELPPSYAQMITPYLIRRFDFGPSFYFVYNYPQSRYVFVEKRIEHILQYQPSELTSATDDFFFSHMHPEDVSPYQLAMQRCHKYMAELPEYERHYYTTSLDYRLQRKDGAYIHLLQQMVCMEYDHKGAPLFSLEKCTSITHWEKHQHMTLSIIGPNRQRNHVFYPNKQIMSKEKYLFSPAELRILKLISQGMTSHEVAEFLNLSFNTVNTHRRNMRKKAGVKSTTSLIRIAQENGLFE
jgi:DNA-binding CsgD family transcriptional regulator